MPSCWLSVLPTAVTRRLRLSATNEFAVRASRVWSNESRRNLHIYEMTGAPALARDLVLRALPARFLVARLDWLFGWRPQ